MTAKSPPPSGIAVTMADVESMKVEMTTQVQQRTIPDTFRILWEQEGVKIFKKGLTARMTSSCIYSVAIIFGYETVKKACVLPEYRERVRW